MNEFIGFYSQMGPGEFTRWMQKMGHLAAPRAPYQLELSASRVRASYQFDTIANVGVQAAVAGDLATLLVAASLPGPRTWKAHALAVEFFGHALSGEINAESRTLSIDWTKSGEQVVTIDGFNGNGSALFVATFTVMVEAG